MVASSREQVLDVLRTHAPALHRQFGVSSIRIFGSFARGVPHATSDVDVLVEFDRPTGIFHLLALQAHLKELLGREVDVGTEGGLRPRVRDRVLAEAVRVA